MQAPRSFVVTPLEARYKRAVDVGGVKLEVTSSIENAKDVDKRAVVLAVPVNYDGPIEVGDHVIVHHNIFREYYNQRGKLTYTRAYIYDNKFHAIPEEVFMYCKDGVWHSTGDYTMVAPIYDDVGMIKRRRKLTGKVIASNVHPQGQIVGFTPESEYNISIERGIELFRMRDSDICIYYEGT